MKSTSALLIEEEFVSIYPTLVRALGGRMEDAAVVQHLHFWLRVSSNIHDGHRWVYNTYEDWSTKLGVTAEVARRAVKRLERSGVILWVKPNRGKGDHTKWYRIDYEHPLLNPSEEAGETADSGAGEIADSGPGEIADSTSPQQELTARTSTTAPTSLSSPIVSPGSTDEGQPPSPSPPEAAAPPLPATKKRGAATRSKKQYIPSFEESVLCELLADLYEANGNTRPKITPSAHLEMHHLLSTDGPSDQKGWPLERVETIIRWAMADWHWASRINTVNALRRHFDVLREDRNRTIAGSRKDPATFATGRSGVSQRFEAQKSEIERMREELA